MPELDMLQLVNMGLKTIGLITIWCCMVYLFLIIGSWARGMIGKIARALSVRRGAKAAVTSVVSQTHRVHTRFRM